MPTLSGGVNLEHGNIDAAQVICSRGQRQSENACGIEVAGAEVTQSSQLVLKQEYVNLPRSFCCDLLR